MPPCNTDCMAEEISVAGKTYLSSRRASEISGYTQDYIGQLSRANLVDAERIGGLWYVSIESLNSYKIKAEQYVPEPPKHVPYSDPESLISFDGMDYISASRASKVTGYNQDYVGQLARSGKIMSRQVGNRWYVEREGILAHKREKDALLAAVQKESVGIRYPSGPADEMNEPGDANTGLYTYSSGNEQKDLIASPRKAEDAAEPKYAAFSNGASQISANRSEHGRTIPIRVMTGQSQRIAMRQNDTSIAPISVRPSRNTNVKAMIFGVTTLTVVLVIGILLMQRARGSYLGSSTAAQAVVNKIGDMFEILFVPELTYKR